MTSERAPIFVESNGRVAIEADHPTVVEQGTTRWEAVDPGIIVDRIVVFTNGEDQRSYLGPHETRD